MRNPLMLTTIAIAVALAGCSGSGDESLSESTQPRDTSVPGGDPATTQPGCTEEVGAPGGFGESGATRPGQVGTGTGDIGSSVSCGNEATADQTEGAQDASS